MPLEQLPAELLLQIARHLPDSSTPSHLKNLSLTSRALRPVAQEALFTTAKLCNCCRCRVKANALLKLLRTMLERPDLACKVKSLRFQAVRKPVEKLYTDKDFDSADLRNRCILKLEELGFQQTHPWWRSINNSIESSFGGLLLALLPQLTDVDFCVKDHQHGTYSSEYISGLWGGTSPPESALHNWKNVNRLIIGDASMLKCGIQFDSLTTLDLRAVSIGTVLRLNGPGSLQGAENVTDLALSASIQFADKDLVEKAEVEFSGLLEALACRALKTLSISLHNDGYNIDDEMPHLDGGYFLSQLYSVRDTLETLAITIVTTDRIELEWVTDMFRQPRGSLVDFLTLKSVTIPQVFLESSFLPDERRPWDLPPNLEQLDLWWPNQGVVTWMHGLIGCQSGQPSKLPRQFQKLVLTCNGDLTVDPAYFIDDPSEIFWNLWNQYDIETEIYDQVANTREVLHLKHLQDDDSEDDDSEDDDKRATLVLALLKQRFSPDSSGLTVFQIAVELGLGLQQTQKAVATLHRSDRILAPSGLGEGSRVQFLNHPANIIFLGVMIRGNFGGTSVDEQLGLHPCIRDFLDVPGGDDGWEDDDGPHRDVRDLSQDPTVCILSGPVIPPLSRVGRISETAVLRWVRQCGPFNHLGITFQEIATSLGTNYEEVASRMDSLRNAGYIRTADDKAYFICENDELLREDLS